MHISLRPIAAATVAVLIAAGAAPALAEEPGTADRARIEQVVRDYLLKNPEIVVEALRNYEQKQQAESRRAATAALAANRDALERDPRAPVAGNRDGDVTVVEFFDYRCGYCKKVTPTLQALLKADPKVRVVFKEFPILGPESQQAAQAAQAVWKIEPAKYLPFHVALMESRGALDEARILEIARSVGIDTAKLKGAMADKAVAEKLSDNLALAQALQIGGTPAFVVGDQLLPGAVDLETLQEAVRTARER